MIVECVVDKAEVLRYLGYRGQELDSVLSDRIDAIIKQCETELTPKGVYEIFPLEPDEDSPQEIPRIKLVGTNLEFEGKSIAKHLAGAHSAAVLATTLGAKSEQRLRQLSASDPLTAMIYDASCSSLVESSAKAMQAEICQQAEMQGLTINRRYSPGYGDFPLETQPALLRVLNAEKRIGLTSTDSSLLLPSKSVTAVIGLFEASDDPSQNEPNSPYKEKQ